MDQLKIMACGTGNNPGSQRPSTGQAILDTEAAHTPVFWNPVDKFQGRGLTPSNSRKIETSMQSNSILLNHPNHAFLETHSPQLEAIGESNFESTDQTNYNFFSLAA